MTRDDWKGMFANFPEEEHNKLVLVLSNGSEISVDTVFRFEPHYFVCRGRVGGTIDEARGFFIPYAQMVYVRYERSMKLEELEAMLAAKPDATTLASPVAETPTPPSRTPTPLGLPRPVLPSPSDPAAASRLLLERIKAARTQTVTRGGSATQG